MDISPTNENLIIYTPLLFQTCIHFYLTTDILKNVGNQTVVGPIGFHTRKKYDGCQWGPEIAWSHSSKYNFIFSMRLILF